MSKYLAAALILALLLAGSLLNARHVDRLTETLSARADEISALAERGELETALSAAEEAEALWRKADVYTSVVVRHSESDAVADAFADLFTALYGGDAAEVRGAARKLQAHLREIARMEHIRFGTVF